MARHLTVGMGTALLMLVDPGASGAILSSCSGIFDRHS